jgi:hypothetical protein
MQKTAGIFLLMVLPFLLADCRRPGPVGIDVTELTIAKIHLAYQEGRYSCAQLVQAYIERIKRYDHAINAITMINPGAIEIARALRSGV